MADYLTQYNPTFVTPVETSSNRLVLQAVYFETPIDLEALQGHYVPMQVLNSDPLLLQMPGQAHVVVLRFGAAVLWNCGDEVVRKVVKEIGSLPGMKGLADGQSDDTLLDRLRARRLMQGSGSIGPSGSVGPAGSTGEDTLMVRLGQGEDQVNFKDVSLKELTLEHIKIISETFGQSVALRHCEQSVKQALAQAGPLVDNLRSRGGLPQSEKELLRMVGLTMAIRETILGKLTLFDEPPEAAHSERFARLHHQLYDYFHIKNRLSGIEAKLEFLADLSTMLMEVLQHRGSNRLEVIVVLLIVVEVILGLLGFVLGHGH
jgi:uncharacterized Rmd1/YagE family protein